MKLGFRNKTWIETPNKNASELTFNGKRYKAVPRQIRVTKYLKDKKDLSGSVSEHTVNSGTVGNVIGYCERWSGNFAYIVEIESHIGQYDYPDSQLVIYSDECTPLWGGVKAFLNRCLARLCATFRLEVA